MSFDTQTIADNMDDAIKAIKEVTPKVKMTIEVSLETMERVKDLLNNEFHDTEDWPWLHEKRKGIVRSARELGFKELAEEMERDL